MRMLKDRRITEHYPNNKERRSGSSFAIILKFRTEADLVWNYYRQAHNDDCSL